MTTNPVIWQPPESRVRASAMYKLMSARGLPDYAALHAWSVMEPAEFWGGLAAERLKLSSAADCVVEQPGGVFRPLDVAADPEKVLGVA